MARRRPDRTDVGLWFRVGTDILSDLRLLRLRDKRDRMRYLELCALAKRSVDHTRSDAEIGDLLAGFGDPMQLADVARELREDEPRVKASLQRIEAAMPGAIAMRDGRYHLTNFAKRQYDSPSDMPHHRSTQAPRWPQGDPTKRPPTETGKAAAARGCPFCRKPTKGPLQHYHDEAKRVLGRCLVIPPGKAGPAISRVEALVGQERAHQLFSAYLASEDQFVLKQGYSLLTFASESIQNGLAAAVDGAYTHGATSGRRRRLPPAPPEAFKRTGRVKL